MISAFDLEKLRGLLHDFYEITKIRITVFDENRNELIACPEKVADFCRIIRSSETGRLACAACDKNACVKAAEERKTQIYRCHAGLTEAVTPLIVNDVLVGYLLFGHVFSYPSHEKGWKEIEKRCRNLPVNLETLKAACRERPLTDEKFVLSATHILLAVAGYLVMERMATLRADKLAVQLDGYLSAHFTEHFTAPELCGKFGIGKTQLYKLSKQLYGCGIAEQVRKLRLARAKQLLLDGGGLTLAEISARCGYGDYNYFISVFSRTVGCSPGAWRKNNL
jgi:AraC-like DNA-binding protein